VPTFDEGERFWGDYGRLTARQRALFRRARREFVEALRAWENGGFVGLARFPSHLGVKATQGYAGIWELAWAPDGRCTWEYGRRVRPDRCHVIWRRIGSHDIYDDP
jgi:hypothetical protein